MNGEHLRFHLIRVGIVALLLASVLSACDLGPGPTPTPTVPPPPPTVPPQPTTAPAPTAAATSTPKPQPTATTTAVPSPTATQPAPAATKVPYKYEAPELKLPKDKDGYGGQLIWESFDLADDEYYHIFVHSIHNTELRHWGFDTEAGKKEGKFLLPREQFGDKDNNWKTLSDTGEFTWEVQVMRKLASGKSVPISPLSETWTFTWIRSTD